MRTKTSREKLTDYKIMVNIPQSLKTALEEFISKNFPPGEQVLSMVVREALASFLKDKGYL